MTYQITVDSIRTAALAALGLDGEGNQFGRFVHGRIIDASQAYDGKYPLIVLYPFQIRQSVDPDFLDGSDLLVAFWKQDSAVSTPEDREAIISQMDTLSDLFLSNLTDNKYVRFSGVIKEPQYQFYSGTLSGFALRMTYTNFDPEC